MERHFWLSVLQYFYCIFIQICVEDADLVITVTTSSYPVFDAKNIKNGATVSCVGTYEPHKRELDSALLPRASKIICDDKKAALSETGDLLLPISEGIICESDIQGSLGDVLNETMAGRENDDEIIVYETVGFAAMDLITEEIRKGRHSSVSPFSRINPVKNKNWADRITIKECSEKKWQDKNLSVIAAEEKRDTVDMLLKILETDPYTRCISKREFDRDCTDVFEKEEDVTYGTDNGAINYHIVYCEKEDLLCLKKGDR